jgi:PIN like domain
VRGTFREWYPPTKDELGRLWADAVVILDSSVLLGLYQYPPATLDAFLAVLDRLRDRLWLPHQVGLEYHRNREGRIPEQRLVLDRVMREIESLGTSLDSLGLPEFHPTLDFDVFESGRTDVKEALSRLAEQVHSAREETPEMSPTEIVTHDPLFARISELFEGRVGAGYTATQLADVAAEGARRYDAEQPPGFRDRHKDERLRYDDLVIWKQILEMAKKDGARASRPSILVTNDRKDDWWRRRQSLILGPRTELIREYLDEVGEDFYMYTPSEFLKAAREHLLVDVSPETIEDVRRISFSSRVAALLRSQRMVIPQVNARIRALVQLYSAISAGAVSRVEDLNVQIRSLGGDFASGYIATPLFFSLINEAYGPITVDADPARLLRDRRVVGLRDDVARDAFLERAHAAWLAQALYRIRLESVSDDELLSAFFPEEYSRDAASVLRRAQEFVALDLAQRGG